MTEYKFKCEICGGPYYPCELTIITPNGTALEYPPDTCIISKSPGRYLASWELVEDHKDR